MNTTVAQDENFSLRCQKVLATAKQLYAGRPDWVTFFRETLGVNGAARSVFPDQEEYVAFEQSNEFAEIQTMMGNLRTRKSGDNKNEATKVITVRLPESLHEALKAEANDHNTSMNKLCISKLLQVLVDADNEAQAQAQAQQSQENPLGTPVPQQPAVPSSVPPQTQPTNFRSTYTPTPPPQSPTSFGRDGQN